MTKIMHSLEIRRMVKGEIIAKELEECGEVLFVMEGRYNVGYEINKIVKLRKQFGPSTTIGSFQICFHKRFLFIYKVHTDMICYAISRKKWFNIHNDFPQFYRVMKEKIVHHYKQQIYTPLMNQKNKDIKNLEKRKDFQQILAMNDPEFKEINKCMESIVEEELQ